MTVVLVRHVHAGDRGRWDGDDRQRPVSSRGEAQADALAATLRSVAAERGTPVRALWSSPYVRCVQSLRPLAAALDLDIEEVDDLAEGTPPDLVGRLLRRATHLAAEHDGAVVLCSHGDVIGDTVTGWAHQGHLHGLHPRWPKASAWIVRDLPGDHEVSYLPPPEAG